MAPRLLSLLSKIETALTEQGASIVARPMQRSVSYHKGLARLAFADGGAIALQSFLARRWSDLREGGPFLGWTRRPGDPRHLPPLRDARLGRIGRGRRPCLDVRPGERTAPSPEQCCQRFARPLGVGRMRRCSNSALRSNDSVRNGVFGRRLGSLSEPGTRCF
jgi:hypothetical protein